MSLCERARRTKVLFSWIGNFEQNFLNFTAVHNEFIKLYIRVFEKAFVKMTSVIAQLKQKRDYKCFKVRSATGKFKKTGLTLKDREQAFITSQLRITEMYQGNFLEL